MLSETAAPSGAGGAEARLAHLAYHDSLTGLPNRARLAERLHAALEHAGCERTIVLLSIDLDDFKLVNDGLGHAAGDQPLRLVAARLDRVRRPSDVLARQGGDEFVLLVELDAGVDARAAVASIGQRISELLEAPFTVAGAELRIAASVGAATYPEHAGDAESLHHHADSAMYQAKQSGSGLETYRPGHADPLARLAMAASLRRGLQTGAVFLHYQPIYRLPERELVGVEALARWRDEAGGLVGPDEFIPVAEKTGVIKIDRSFMEDFPDNPQAAAIVKATLETEAQLRYLAEHRCRLVQGFGLGRPQTASRTTELLRSELIAGRRG